MKIFIKTYGCQANVNDSEIISGILAKNGYELAENEEDADYIILNSCSVKNKTQSKIIDYIRKHKDKKIIATGCLTKTIDIKKFGKNVYVKNFLNNKNKINLPIVRNKKDLTIVLSKDQSILLNQKPVSEATLQEKLFEEAQLNPETMVIIRADQNSSHGFVVRIMDYARNAGLTKLAIATDPKSR